MLPLLERPVQVQVRVAALDWGGTLMEELPYSGAMVDWPRVEAVPGALEGLQALRARGLRLVVATNAANSDADQVRAALGRVGMDSLIERVYTSAQLGELVKPALEYFAGLCTAEAVEPGQVVMIGDSLTVDVHGAAAAGLRTIWYNPGGQSRAGADVVQDAELGAGEMAALGGAVDSLVMPSLAQIRTWMDAMEVPKKIRAHSRLVAAAAYHMAVRLKAGGEIVNPVLAYRGGLLHDLAKILTRGSEVNLDHGQAAGHLLAAAGQPVLAEIARRHMLFCLLEPERMPRSWEEKLVYFADKLAEGSQLVTPEERLRALQQRYTMGRTDLAALLPALNQLQAEICAHLNIAPAELNAWLEQAIPQQG